MSDEAIKDQESAAAGAEEAVTEEAGTEALADAIAGEIDAGSGDPEAGEGIEDGDQAEQGEDAAQAEGEAGEEDAAAETDPLEEPEGLSDSAKARFHKLVDTVKEKERELETVSQQLQQIRSVLQDSGATPEEFSQSLEYIRALKSGTREGFEYARNVLQEQLRQINLALGETQAQVDVLPPELRKKVEDMEMSEEDALQLVRAQEMQRAQQQAMLQQQQQQQQAMQAQQMQAQMQQRIEMGAEQLRQLEAQWQQNDPDYGAKRKLLEQQIPLIAQTVPPEMWATALQQAYDVISQAAQQAKPKSPTPLTGGSGAAGQGEPKDLESALLNAFGMQ